MDIFSKTKRSDIMSRVKSSGTDIESHLLKCVKPLWKKERYRKNAKNLPGKPDIVFPASKIAIFADGDFWHGKGFEKWGKRVPAFWKKKISGNIARDKQQTKALKKQGYKVLRLWGSYIKKNPKAVSAKVLKLLKKQ